jgi:hypothetical protein
MKTTSHLSANKSIYLIVVLLLAVFNTINAQAPLSVSGNGNVGVGTEQPQAKLHVAGDAGINGIIDLGINQQGREGNAGKIGYGTFDPGSLCIVGAGTSGSTRKITFWNEGGARFNGWVMFANNVSINKTTQPTEALEVNGRIKDQTGYVVPVGGIIMYSGNSASLFDGSGFGKPNTPVGLDALQRQQRHP